MPTIDSENAKQIRQPMDVLITMSLADDDITMSYSGYSDAKVADGVLNQRGWPMRKLADLQGEGFPLDGSCVLYDSATTPSQGNGKLGVRSNVGQTVTVTATGNKTMASIGASVSGAESVTMNGVTTDITSSTVVLPLLDTSATLTFDPAYEDRRIEISAVLPEADFKITNDNLIRATVSLRSDLSIIDPTLPESEINIEAYFDKDVSEAVASISEDTPILYQAGYIGDMSPERKFYVSGQVTWADNVLSIHAVDAVHFIGSLPETISYDVFNKWEAFDPIAIDEVGFFVRRMLQYFEIKFTDSSSSEGFYTPEDESTRTTALYNVDTEGRAIIAEMMNLFHVYLPEYSRKTGYYHPVYVDAGRPTLRTARPTSSSLIYEDDCAEIKQNFEPLLQKVAYSGEDTSLSGPNANPENSEYEVGSLNITYKEAAFLTIDDDALSWVIGLPASEYYGSGKTGIVALVPAGTDGWNIGLTPWADINYDPLVGQVLISNKTKQRLTSWAQQTGTLYTSVIPWNARFSRAPWSFDELWEALKARALVGNDTKQFEMKLYGTKLIREPIELEIKRDIGSTTYNLETVLLGSMWGTRTEYGPIDSRRVFPELCIESLFNRSNNTVSFRWKGDPRIQPRDVFTWHRNDGSEEDWTFENITLTHEGGGTYADITARKGVV